jgi:hypothetical protein
MNPALQRLRPQIMKTGHPWRLRLQVAWSSKREPSAETLMIEEARTNIEAKQKGEVRKTGHLLATAHHRIIGEQRSPS